MNFELTLPGKKLQDDIFCLSEERKFFELKMLEQVNEITELKKQFLNSKKEVTRLRGELMGELSMSLSLSSDVSPKDTVEAAEENYCNSDDISLTEGCVISLQKDDQSDDDSQKSAKEVRKSAKALLKWADFRSSSNTVKTSATSTISSLVLSIPGSLNDSYDL